MLKNLLKPISVYIQNSKTSFKRHNSELSKANAFEIERAVIEQRLATEEINGAELKVLDVLRDNPRITTVVDIGSGAGWASGAVSPHVQTVIAIEPSQAGIDIAKRVFPTDTHQNITWHHGFAEDILPTLQLTTPVLYITGCVLSHLRDQEVVKICNAINATAPTGSCLALAEAWHETNPYHQIMWHVRTKTWWQNNFPGWELNFGGPSYEDGKFAKGIWGVKK